MILLSNCLTDVPDEGCLKVANSLAKRIKQADKHVLFLSTARRSRLTDVYLEINKMLLSGKLVQILRKQGEPLLYIPFPNRSLPNAVRIFWLSLICPKGVRVVFTMTYPYNWLAKGLLKLSKAHLYVLSRVSADYYMQMLGTDKVTYLKTGVDTGKFVPASMDQVLMLKKKYALDPNRKTVLHVGHMKAGRNIGELTKLDKNFQILLVTSTFTQDSQDMELRKQLDSCENITLIDTYLPNIEELYQLADVYFFPVMEQGNCIDVPLSCLEAAACGTPVVTTKYGEMEQFVGKPGFYFFNHMDSKTLNEIIAVAAKDKTGASRESVLDYGWNNAVKQLLM